MSEREREHRQEIGRALSENELVSRELYLLGGARSHVTVPVQRHALPADEQSVPLSTVASMDQPRARVGRALKRLVRGCQRDRCGCERGVLDCFGCDRDRCLIRGRPGVSALLNVDDDGSASQGSLGAWFGAHARSPLYLPRGL